MVATIDLHIHTVYSDGRYAPEDVLRQGLDQVPRSPNWGKMSQDVEV